MGISNLSKLIKSNTKRSVRERSLQFYTGKTIAIDASMSIYQFLIAIRSNGTTLGNSDSTTSHIIGFFYRTISIVESGIKPLFVFDGVAPEFKIKELQKRNLKREEASLKYEEAKEKGDVEKMEMFEKRKVKINKQHIEDCKNILDLLKVPYVVAPSEAEAYCAYLNKIGRVYAVATEDMDALTFGAPLVLRNFSSSKKAIVEFNLKIILEELQLKQSEFIDLCILLGCDFCGTLKKVGPKTAFSLIKTHKNIEEILELKSELKNEEFCYESARLIFNELPNGEDFLVPEIDFDGVNLNEIKEFLVEKYLFSEERVVKAVERYLKCKNVKKQTSLDCFFKN